MPTYISKRHDTGSFTFRYVVPVDVRPILGGRREITKSLNTEDKRLALRLARRLAAMMNRLTFDLMAKRSKQEELNAALTVKLVEKLVDGTMRIEGLEMDSDPARAEEERKHLAALLGKSEGAAAAAPADERTLDALVKAYFAEGDREKRWRPKTRDELEAIYKLMLEILGAEKPVAGTTRKDAAYFKDMLAKLPSNRNKDPRYRSKTVLELAGMTIPEADLLSVSSANKMLVKVSSLFKYAVQHGWIAANPAEGMTYRKKKRDDQERDPFTDKDVQTLVDAVTSGAHGSDRSPYMKWVPLIGVYSGMRLNEICQLETSDIQELEGVHVFSVNDDGEGKRLKTASARRYVPIHPELVAIGLLTFIEDQRKRGQTRLFPELPVGRDGPGQLASKWFARFRQRLGIGKEFHAIRHWFVNSLRRAHVPETLIADLVGHSRGTTETAKRYMKAAEIEQLRDAVSKLSYREKTPLRLVSGT